MHKFYDIHKAYEVANKEITVYPKKKINIIDESERQQTLKYIKGFKTGRNNTIIQIINAKNNGLNMKQIYKVIKQIYDTEVINANINHEH